MRIPSTAAALATSLALVPAGMVLADEVEEPQFTAQFPLDQCSFQTVWGNPYFRLVVGRQLYFTNERCVADGRCDAPEELWITVLPQTRRIVLDEDDHKRTVRTRVVEEYETEDGEVKEVSRNFYADCRPGHDVYYFGEEVFDGEGNPLEDAWLAGEDGNRPGIIMPGGAFLLGSRYFQEIAPDVALDRAEHVALGMLVHVPAGLFENCVEVHETTPLEPGHVSPKVYCPGIGLVQDGDLELKAIRHGQRSRAAQKDD
ncbi:MAG: hypothetical protein IT486_07800 [Gammaproteobacteria bacterium]|nr:hypothetical protein [Gammaproteobacteria bacterium]